VKRLQYNDDDPVGRMRCGALASLYLRNFYWRWGTPGWVDIYSYGEETVELL